jgi:hypothetical protein
MLKILGNLFISVNRPSAGGMTSSRRATEAKSKAPRVAKGAMYPPAFNDDM